MEETFSQRGKVLVNDTSRRSYDSTSIQQLGPDFANRVAQLVAYGLLVTRINMVEHIFYILLNIKLSTIISHTLLLIDVVSVCWH